MDVEYFRCAMDIALIVLLLVAAPPYLFRPDV